MKIRKANIADLPRIEALVNSGLAEFGFKYSPLTSEFDLENFEEHYLGRKGKFLVLVSEKNEILGCGAVLRLNHTNQYKIRKMYVSKSHRGLGYGRLILEALINLAKKRKGTQAILETSNLMTSAIKLYESYGFVKADIKPTSPRCDLTMTKNIKDD